MKLLPKKCAIFVLVLAEIAFAAPAGHAQSPTVPLVTLDSGPIVQLCASCSSQELRMAVTPKPGFRVKQANNSQEDPAVVEVSFGNLRDASLIPKIAPRWDVSPDGI